MGISSILLVVHLIIALSMVGIILLQPSDGGGTGLGSDAGNSSFSQVRGKGTFLTKLTWALATAFVVVALLLAWLSRSPSANPGSNLQDLIEEPAPAPAAADVFSSTTPAEPVAPEGDAAAASSGESQ